MIAQGAKAESHRANAMAFQLTQTNLNPKNLNRVTPRLPVRQQVMAAAISSTGPHRVFDIYLSLRSKCAF